MYIDSDFEDDYHLQRNYHL